MNFDGVLDSTAGGMLRGWAFDATAPESPVEVTFTLPNGWTRTATADEFRPDLLQAGIGDGRHGFTCQVPRDLTAGPEELSVTVRMSATGDELRGSPARIEGEPPLQVVAGDIVNNCNLRCPFCIVDYKMVRDLRQMPRATFERSLSLLPLVRDGGFWLSCMHEPTLHAEFATLLETIPAVWRRKVSFTTNLCKRMDDEMLRRIAHSGVHSIRVSFDSMNPELFAQLRKGGRFEVFVENLRKIVAFLQTAEQAVPLHFISMAFQENAAELADLAVRCREEFRAAIHEVRFMYYAPHLAEWGEGHILNPEGWEALKSTLRARAPWVMFGDPEANVFERFRTRDGVERYEHPPAVFGGLATRENYQRVDPLATGFALPDEELRLRLRWDGLLMMEQLPEWEFRVNLLDLPDPAAYVRALRAAGARRQPHPDLGWHAVANAGTA